MCTRKDATGVSELRLTDTQEVSKIIKRSQSKTCDLGSLRTAMLKETLEVHLQHLVETINASFTSGSFPVDFKSPLVRPLLKKLTLNKDIYKNYRSVSNLAFIGKVTEKVASSRLLAHMQTNGLEEEHQSAYRQFHSTETAILKVQGNVARVLGGDQAALLLYLDLSAAFDTVDKDRLLDILMSTSV